MFWGSRLIVIKGSNLNFSELFLSNILKIRGEKLWSEFLTFRSEPEIRFFSCMFTSQWNSSQGLHCLFSLLGDHMALESPPSFIQNRHGPAPCSFPPSLSLSQIVIQTVSPPLMCSLTSHGHTCWLHLEAPAENQWKQNTEPQTIPEKLTTSGTC